MSDLRQWLSRACAELGLDVEIDPRRISAPNVRPIALVRNLGFANGMLVFTSYDQVQNSAQAILDAGYGYSVLSEPATGEKFDLEGFKEMFRDWGWSAEATSKPHWMPLSIGSLETPDLEASDTAFVSLVTAEEHIGVLIGLVRGDHQEICLSKDDAQALVRAIRLAADKAVQGSTTVRTRDPEESRDATITIAFATDRVGINVDVIDEGYVQLWVSNDGARAIASAFDAAIAGVPL